MLGTCHFVDYGASSPPPPPPCSVGEQTIANIPQTPIWTCGVRCESSARLMGRVADCENAARNLEAFVADLGWQGKMRKQGNWLLKNPHLLLTSLIYPYQEESFYVFWGFLSTS